MAILTSPRIGGIVLPVSATSTRKSSSACSSSFLAKIIRISERSLTDIAAHAGQAASAAVTALSTSALVAEGSLPMTSSVAGLTESSHCWPTLSTSDPPISIRSAFTRVNIVPRLVRLFCILKNHRQESRAKRSGPTAHIAAISPLNPFPAMYCWPNNKISNKSHVKLFKCISMRDHVGLLGGYDGGRQAAYEFQIVYIKIH